MLANFRMAEKEICRNRAVVLQTDAENNKASACEQGGIFRQNIPRNISRQTVNNNRKPKERKMFLGQCHELQ